MVERHELPRKGVRVRCDVAPVHHERVAKTPIPAQRIPGLKKNVGRSDVGTNDDGQVVQGIKISLVGTAVNGSMIMLVTHTGADGSYSFTGLLPGTYRVSETLPKSLQST